MMTKQDVLDAAKKAVSDRGMDYGKPEANFDRIAAYWRVHLWNRFHVEIEMDALSVAAMMELMKLARRDHEPFHLDSIIDSCGYAACAGEIATETIGRADKEEGVVKQEAEVVRGAAAYQEEAKQGLEVTMGEQIISLSPDPNAPWRGLHNDQFAEKVRAELLWNHARSGPVHG